MEIKLRSTSPSIMQHRITWWPNECNIVKTLILRAVSALTGTIYIQTVVTNMTKQCCSFGDQCS